MDWLRMMTEKRIGPVDAFSASSRECSLWLEALDVWPACTTVALTRPLSLAWKAFIS